MIKWYLIALALLVYFSMILPWLLSQANDAIVIGGFISLAVVVYLVIVKAVQLVNRLQ